MLVLFLDYKRINSKIQIYELEKAWDISLEI